MTFQIDVDKTSRPLGMKVRQAKNMKYNLIFVLGEKNLTDEALM